MGSLEDLVAETRNVLSEVLAPGQEVALLDFPYYQNPGDSLIFLGTRCYLQELGVSLRYVADIWRYDSDSLRQLHPSGPILLQGGGSFGDRWTRLQAFRERVICDFPDRQIIQLPQTLDFENESSAKRTAAVYGAHGDLTIMIRDRGGAERAKVMFPHNSVLFCPDLSLGYGSIASRRAGRRVLQLKRTDLESQTDKLTLHERNAPNQRVRDWGLNRLELLRWRSTAVVLSLMNRVPRISSIVNPLAMRVYGELAEQQVASARRILAPARVVVTDRLHAAVLAVLMGKQAVALDNANGKVGSLYRDYLYRLSGFNFATDPAAATAILSELVD